MDKNELSSLLINLKQGNMDYFPVFFDLTKKAIFLSSYVLLKRKEEAEDIVSETYIKFLESIENVNPKKNVMAYLTSIARNESLNLLKKRQRESELEDDDCRLSSNDEYDLGLNLFDKARKILPLDEFEILIMSIVDELKHREIAHILKKPIGTVSFKYSKAIKTLRKELGNERF